MKILIVIGSGGREHAIVTSVAKKARKLTKYIVHLEMQELQLWQSVLPIGAMEFDKLALHLQRRNPLILPLLVWMIRWLAESWMSLRQRA